MSNWVDGLYNSYECKKKKNNFICGIKLNKDICVDCSVEYVNKDDLAKICKKCYIGFASTASQPYKCKDYIINANVLSTALT